MLVALPCIRGSEINHFTNFDPRNWSLLALDQTWLPLIPQTLWTVLFGRFASAVLISLWYPVYYVATLTHTRLPFIFNIIIFYKNNLTTPCLINTFIQVPLFSYLASCSGSFLMLVGGSWSKESALFSSSNFNLIASHVPPHCMAPYEFNGLALLL